MNKDIEQRIAWINERVPLDGLQISYIKFQMQEHTKLLIDEIEQQKMQCSVYHNDILNLEGEKAGLIDEIAELKKQVEYQKSGYVTLKEYLKTDDILGAIMKLKSELKASKSEANEALQKSHDELLKIAKHYIKNHDYWVIANADKLTRNNK